MIVFIMIIFMTTIVTLALAIYNNSDNSTMTISIHLAQFTVHLL